MNIKSWQDVLLEVVETDPADFTDRKNICISPKDLGDILRAALQERDARMPPAVLMNQLINDKLELSIKLAAQRKVLEQALDALKNAPVFGPRSKQHKDAITAIQGVLNE